MVTQIQSCCVLVFPDIPSLPKILLMLDLDMLLGSLNLSDKFNHVLMLSYSCIKSILYKLWC